MWLRFECCDPDVDVDSSGSRRWKKIHLERRVNIYVDASDEKGKFLC